MPAIRVYKPKLLTEVTAEQVFPIQPSPYFRSHTTHVKVIQGGFMDDGQMWHKAPNKIKEAVKINGTWYWACKIRDKKGNLILSKSLLQ